MVVSMLLAGRTGYWGVQFHLAELVQSTLGVVDGFGPFLHQTVAMLQHIAMRFQPRVKLKDT
jgi:hypothetical protein